jgi:hypothetical protein
MEQNSFLEADRSSASQEIYRIIGFLDSFRRLIFYKKLKDLRTRHFGSWICYRPQESEGGVTKKPTQLGPVERANLSHWTLFMEPEGSLPHSQ